MHSRRFRLSALFPLIALAALLSACTAGATQVDPAGQNSGSPQFAEGTFNFDTSETNVATGSTGSSVNVYNSFTTVTTAITVNSASFSTDIANQNDNTVTLPDGMRFLVLDITLLNTSTANCLNPKNGCKAFISPLENFRLTDDTSRIWPSTTGAKEPCTTDPHIPCSNRLWVQEANPQATPPANSNEVVGGIAPGQSFSNRIAFTVPNDQSTFTLYFAPYRFPDTTALLSGGNASGQNLPTLAAITLNP